MAVLRRRAGCGAGRALVVLALIAATACSPDGNCANEPDVLDHPEMIAENVTITERAGPTGWTRVVSELLDRQGDRATVQVTVEEGESSTDYIVRLHDVGLGNGSAGCSWEVTEIEQVP